MVAGLLMFIYMVFGYAAHLLKPMTTDHISSNWRNLSNYGLGVSYVLPLGTILFVVLEKDISNNTIRFIVSYVLSFLPFGIGVIAGYRYESMRGIYGQ